jgi:hypothetical protein
MKAHLVRPHRRSAAPEEEAAPVVAVAPRVPPIPLVLHMPLRAGRRAPSLISLDPWRAKDPMLR